MTWELATIGNFLGGLSVPEGFAVIEPLIIFVIGLVVYSLFVFKFYKFIAKKDIFKLSQERGTAGKVAYVLKYIFLFPIVSFFWFFVIAVLVSMLSGVLKIENIFMVSMAIITTVRVAAHYDEDLSREVAKLIPLAMLGVLLLDISNISYNVPLQVINQISAVASVLVYYFIFLILLEFVLRAVSYAIRAKIK